MSPIPVQQKTMEMAEDEAVKAIRKYYKHQGMTKCPRCEKMVNTLIFSNGDICCSFCQRLNWFDIVSVIGKTPDGIRDTHAISTHYIDPKNKLNNMIVRGVMPTPLSWLLHKITFGKYRKRPWIPGYLKFHINSALLLEKKAFQDKYVVVTGFTRKDLVKKYFGDVAMMVEQKQTVPVSIPTAEKKPDEQSQNTGN